MGAKQTINNKRQTKMGTKTFVKNVSNEITVPSKYYFYVPFGIFTVVFLIIGYYILRESYKEGGMSYFSEECKKAAEAACLGNDDPQCVDNYLKNAPNCRERMLSKGSLVGIHIIFSLIFAGTVAFGILKLAFYVKNPKIAIGIFALKTIF